MSWTAPAATDLQAAFPAFSGVPTPTIDYWLTRAARMVDQSWPDEDGPHGQMLLTAHYLVQQGLGTSAEAQAFAAGAARFKRIRSGALELDQYDQSNWTDLETTTYGRQFAALLRRVKGGARVTGTGAIPCGAPYGRPGYPW